MVVVEIIDTGQILDVTNAEITYVKQVADFGDITKANASYSWSFSIPKNPNNTKIFESLGIAGDTSTVPYRKVYCRLTDNGVAIVSKGLLNIKETAKDYKAHIQEGIVEFYKDIANDKIGETLDLSEINHVSSVTNIINSFTQDTYRYIIADYNGAPLANVEGVTNLNPFALVPSVGILWLWNKIFDYYGWTWSGSVDFSDYFMTYPLTLGYDENDVLNVINVNSQNLTNNKKTPTTVEWQNGGVDQEYISEVNSVDDENVIIGFQVLASGHYLIEFRGDGYVNATNYFQQDSEGTFRTTLRVDGFPLEIYNNSDEEQATQIEMMIYAGQTIQLTTNVSSDIYNMVSVQTVIENIYLQASLINVDFEAALLKFKTADFFKEIMIRFGLTPFTDVDNKHIEFKTFNERLDAPVDDWSDKYVERTSETYLYNNYAQNNYLKHKYDDEDEENDYADGNLKVNNRNLKIEKTLYESKTYAPLEGFTPILGNATPPYNAPQLKMFEVELSKNEEEEIIAEYKGLKNRFYIVQSEIRNDDIYIAGELAQQFPIAITINSIFSQIAKTTYRRARMILNGTRVHKIDLNLSKFDFTTLDLSRRKYFSQENAYYILNKLTWKKGKVTTGEFIKIAENPNIDNEILIED